MDLNVVGQHMEITPAIREYAEKKLSRLLSAFASTKDVHVKLAADKVQHSAEINMRYNGKDLHCEVRGADVYAAIDVLADKAERMVRREKEKATDHHKAVSQKRSL